jgi:hypothetical protein
MLLLEKIWYNILDSLNTYLLYNLVFLEEQESVACVKGASMNSGTSLPQWRTGENGSSQPMKTFGMVPSPEQGAESGWTIQERTGNISRYQCISTSTSSIFYPNFIFKYQYIYSASASSVY